MTVSELKWQSSGQPGMMLTSSQSRSIMMDVVLMAESYSIAQTSVSFGNVDKKRLLPIAQLVIWSHVIPREVFEVAAEARILLDALR